MSQRPRGAVTIARVVIGFRFPDREAVDQTYLDLTQAGYVGQQERVAFISPAVS